MNLFFETCDFLRKQGDLSILNFFLGKRELKKLKTIFSDTVFFTLSSHVQINGKRFPLKFRISRTLIKSLKLKMNMDFLNTWNRLKNYVLKGMITYYELHNICIDNLSYSN